MHSAGRTWHARRRPGAGGMSTSTGRVLVVAAACLVWMTGCETSTKLTGFLGGQQDDPATTASVGQPAEGADPATTGTVAVATATQEVEFPSPEYNAATPNV